MKKSFLLSLLAFVLIATTFTFADNTGLQLKGSKGLPDLTPTQISCIQGAVDKRETSIITYENAFQSAISQALTTRKTDLLNARSLTSKADIKTAVKKSRNAFRASKTAARQTLRTGEKSAWTTFKTDTKACQVSNIVSQIEKENLSTTKTID